MKLSIVVGVYNQEELIIKALDSVPRRNDIEIVICDDCSTDNTWNVVNEYKNNHSDLNIKLLRNEENMGFGYTKSRCYDNCDGEWIGQLDSDDYLITDEFEKLMNEIDNDYDIIGFDLIVNDGSIFDLNEESVMGLCAGTMRFIKREFLGNMRCPNVRGGEDWHLNNEMMSKNPKIKYTHICAYRYNYPREGSLYDLMKKGLL